MTFHPTARDRHVYLFILALCLALVGFCAYKNFQGAAVKVGSWGQALGVTCFLTVLSAWLNWAAYSAFVRVHDSGLEWKDGNNRGSLTWDDIRGIGFKRYPKFVKPGLVLKSSDDLRFLSFFSPALYAALSGRCGRLPADVERELKFRS